MKTSLKFLSFHLNVFMIYCRLVGETILSDTGILPDTEVDAAATVTDEDMGSSFQPISTDVEARIF